MDYRSFAPGGSNTPPGTPSTPPPLLLPEPQKHFVNHKFASTFVILILLALGAYAGILYLQNQIDSEEIPPAFTPRMIEAVDPLAGWETYKSSLGYSVRYPANWIVVKSDNVIYPPSPDTDDGIPVQYFSVFIEEQTFAKARDYLRKNVDGRNVVESEITLSGEVGYAYQGKLASSSYEVLIKHGNKVYYLWSQRYNLKEVQQIFSTFKFDDPVAGQFCGGIAAVKCPTNYSCRLSGTYPDAGGVCVKDGTVCIQVITKAKNSKTGEIKEFPSPCDLPSGWVQI